MENFIKPKRRTFAEKMSIATKSTANPLDVTTSKPQVIKLIEIKFDPRDEAAIKSRIKKIANVSVDDK